jgi:hypothetical protein
MKMRSPSTDGLRGLPFKREAQRRLAVAMRRRDLAWQDDRQAAEQALGNAGLIRKRRRVDVYGLIARSSPISLVQAIDHVVFPCDPAGDRQD